MQPWSVEGLDWVENSVLVLRPCRSKCRYLLSTTSRRVLYVVFRATLAGDIAQIDFMCSNFYLMHPLTESALLLVNYNHTYTSWKNDARHTASDIQAKSAFTNKMKRLRTFPHITSINIAGSVVHLSDTVTTLGVNLDQTLNLQWHVNDLCKSSYYHLLLSAISEPLCQIISVWVLQQLYFSPDLTIQTIIWNFYIQPS